ncbi:MAG: hypothetical protein ACO3G4_16490, partial [Opitutaceae bacterium]
MTSTTTMTGTCGRCDGTGKIAAFNHYAGGVCFACSGSGVAEVTVTTADAEAQAAIIAEAARKRDWLAKLVGVSPKVVAAQFRALPEAKLWAIRNACAGWNVPGARAAYWAASTVLSAWPDGRPYPAT